MSPLATPPAHALHFGDPCVYCGIAHDDVTIGPCLQRLSPASCDLLEAARAVADYWLADEGYGPVEDTDLCTNMVNARRRELEGGK